jgi:hypothetical protein
MITPGITIIRERTGITMTADTGSFTIIPAMVSISVLGTMVPIVTISATADRESNVSQDP